jgi:adenosylhomocysteine nucleosidase
MRSLFRVCVIGAGLAMAGIPAAPARTVAVLYALDQDWSALARELGGQAAAGRAVAGRTVARIDHPGGRVLGVRMGSGAVSSALAAAAALAHGGVDLVISVGPAGALADGPAPGQWVEAASCIAFQRGRLTGGGVTPGEDATIAWTPSDAWTNLPRVRVASGEAFVAADAARADLARLAAAVDMNLFGVAQACEDARVRHLHLRVLSDRADDAAAEDFRRFLAAYDGEGGRRVAALIRSLPPDPADPATYPGLRALMQPGAAEGAGAAPR